MDIVGYSKLLINQQSELLRLLNEVVRSTEQFRSAEEARMLVRLPTGDGMALAFFSSPDAPVRCAMEIARVHDRDFVNIAPLQLGEDIARIHGLLWRERVFAGSKPIRRRRSAKRGSERRGPKSASRKNAAACCSYPRSSQRNASSFSPSAM